ncbi:MAG: HPr-rel-A system PqqD family peptide chaperone [Pseudomonadota bacterium]|nr:HPr-rel-A system PqqD family peptide chaperone [Pseudomonadota bacterium]
MAWGGMWQLMYGQLLQYRSWDGAEYVLYNDLSGDTHLLGADAALLLLTLKQGAAGEPALLASLNAARDGAEPVAPDQLAALLAQLAALSLLARLPC